MTNETTNTQQQERDAAEQRIADFIKQRVLSGKATPQQVSKDLAEARDQLELVGNVLSALDAQLQAAKQVAHTARIADLRVQAKRLRAEAQPLLEEREKLLQQLERLEGPLYMESPRSYGLLRQADMLEDSATRLEFQATEPERGMERRRVPVEG